MPITVRRPIETGRRYVNFGVAPAPVFDPFDPLDPDYDPEGEQEDAGGFPGPTGAGRIWGDYDPSSGTFLDFRTGYRVYPNGQEAPGQRRPGTQRIRVKPGDASVGLPPVFKDIKVQRGRAPQAPSLTEQQLAHAGYYEEQVAASQARRELEDREFQYKQDQDKLTRERQAALDKQTEAIDQRDFEAAQRWKQVAEDRATRLEAVNEAFRRDELKLRAEIEYASSRRADISTNLARQQQAFTQEESRRRELRAVAANPRDIYGYAFEKAGVPAPPGTSLAELQAQIPRTPDVEDFLNNQQPGVRTISPAQTQGQAGPPVAYDATSIQAELEANRKKQLLIGG